MKMLGWDLLLFWDYFLQIKILLAENLLYILISTDDLYDNKYKSLSESEVTDSCSLL